MMALSSTKKIWITDIVHGYIYYWNNPIISIFYWAKGCGNKMLVCYSPLTEHRLFWVPGQRWWRRLQGCIGSTSSSTHGPDQRWWRRLQGCIWSTSFSTHGPDQRWWRRLRGCIWSTSFSTHGSGQRWWWRLQGRIGSTSWTCCWMIALYSTPGTAAWLYITGNVDKSIRDIFILAACC